MAHAVAPPTDLFSKDVLCETQTALNLALASSLHDLLLQTTVEVIAVRVSVVLLHVDPDGVDRPVSHFSKRFNWPEANYSTFEMETLPLLLALQH